MQINGVELKFDIYDSDQTDRVKCYYDGLEQISHIKENSPKGSEQEKNKYLCGTIKQFFDDVFGEGTGEKVCGSGNNLLKYIAAFNLLVEEQIRQNEAFDKEMDEITKDSKNIYHLVMFDIDLFKAFNDDFGHLFGDRVLTSVGKILLENIPEQSAYRYGGDEFCVIFKNYSEHEIEEKLKLVQKQLKTTQIKGVSVEITISIGVAVKENIMTKEEWIAKADKALYLSKNSGRNQITFSQ